jgi:hypothetical protein
MVKVKLAARLREETTMTVAWIAERLRMGTAGYVNNCLYRMLRTCFIDFARSWNHKEGKHSREVIARMDERIDRLMMEMERRALL